MKKFTDKLTINKSKRSYDASIEYTTAKEFWPNKTLHQRHFLKLVKDAEQYLTLKDRN